MPHRKTDAIKGIDAVSRKKPPEYEIAETAIVPNPQPFVLRTSPDVLHPAPALHTPSIAAISYERPKLTAPTTTPHAKVLSEFRYLKEINKLKERADAINEMQSERLDIHKKHIQRISAENIAKLKENAEKAAASDWWSMLKKIATALLSAISFGLGCALIAGGGSAIAGAVLIASGILSIANFASAEAGVWDAVAKQLAQDDEEKRKKIGLILPIALGIIASALNVYGGIQCMALGSEFLVNRITSFVQIAFGTFQGASTIGKGIADGDFLHAKAELEKTSSALNQERLYLDTVTKWIEHFIAEIKGINEQINQMARMVIQANQTLVQG